MSSEAAMDLRYPIGGLFVVLGLLLGGYGIATGGNTEMYVRATGVNVNLWWGVIMLAFGVLFLIMATRASRRP
jgi:hypothetical protein